MSLFGPACIGCGCTEDRACVTDAGTCSWVSLDPPLCSCCDEADVGPENSAIDACPAATITAPHAPLWRDSTTCYCARCHQVLAA